MNKARIRIRRTPPRTQEMTTTASREAADTNIISYLDVRLVLLRGLRRCYSQSLQLKPAYPNAHLKRHTATLTFPQLPRGVDR